MTIRLPRRSKKRLTSVAISLLNNIYAGMASMGNRQTSAYCATHWNLELGHCEQWPPLSRPCGVRHACPPFCTTSLLARSWPSLTYLGLMYLWLDCCTVALYCQVTSLLCKLNPSLRHSRNCTCDNKHQLVQQSLQTCETPPLASSHSPYP